MLGNGILRGQMSKIIIRGIDIEKISKPGQMSKGKMGQGLLGMEAVWQIYRLDKRPNPFCGAARGDEKRFAGRPKTDKAKMIGAWACGLHNLWSLRAEPLALGGRFGSNMGNRKRAWVMQMSLSNTAMKKVVLRSYPEAHVKASDFAVEEASIPPVTEGTFLVRNVFVSVDPMLRIFIDKQPLGSKLMPSLPLGTTIPGAAVGEVIESQHPDFKVGDIVEGRFGWQTYAVSNGQGINRVPGGYGNIANALAVGGLPGFTAYVGLEAAGGVKPGQTILVSGAAGAVGSAVGALIKARGGRAVGIAGGQDKCRYLIDTVGYDAVADRLSPDFHAQLAQALPSGANVYFDNVGGPMLADMLPFLARGALILISGLMGQYQGNKGAAETDNLPAVLHAVMGNGVSIKSFSQFGQDALRPGFEKEICDLLASGALKPEVHIVEGIDNLPQAQVNLFDHSTTGKVVVRVGADPVAQG